LARHRSLLLGARAARRAAPASTAPLFVTPRDGMGAFVRGVTDAATARGVVVRHGAPVSELALDGNRWRVDGRPAEAVVLATPAAATAPLVAQSAPQASRLLATMDHAGVILVTLAVSTWPERLHGRSGYLVPKPVQRTVTAVSFGSQKWAHWRPASGDEVLRVSLGRDGRSVDGLDDDEVVRRVIDDVGHQLGLDVQPTAVRISRWPAAFPQYRPGHLDWRAAVEGALPAGLYVTGASYGGIGVPACIVQAQATARLVLAGLTS
ncbi:MAG: protoporphyrinogen/coproporphyrinogen oxidase, partial [Ilumatobacteraceae bacterium]